MANELPPAVQEQLAQLQKLQSQLVMAQQQRQQIEFQARESERAAEELATIAEDAPVYRAAGGVFFRAAGRDEVVKRLMEEKELLDVRLAGFQKQEARVREAAQELQSKVQAALKNLQSASPPAKGR